jgi:flagellar biogenesis protein FliO
MGFIACVALAILAGAAPHQDDASTVVLPPALASDPLPAVEAPKPSPVLQLPAEEPRRASPTLEDRPEAGPSAGAFLAGSFIVVALLFGAFLLLKRYGKPSRFLGAGNPIQVIARKSLSPKQEIFLVEVGARVFMIGSTRDRLATLGEFAAPDEVAGLKARMPGTREGSVRREFGDSLREGLREEEGLAVGAAAPREDRVFDSIAEELSEIRKTVRAWRA